MDFRYSNSAMLDNCNDGICPIFRASRKIRPREARGLKQACTLQGFLPGSFHDFMNECRVLLHNIVGLWYEKI